jgi:hypothetical protein
MATASLPEEYKPSGGGKVKDANSIKRAIDLPVAGMPYPWRRKEVMTMSTNCGCGCVGSPSQKTPDLNSGAPSQTKPEDACKKP